MNTITLYICERCRCASDATIHGPGPVCCNCRDDLVSRETGKLKEGWEVISMVTVVACCVLGAVGVSAVLLSGVAA